MHPVKQKLMYQSSISLGMRMFFCLLAFTFALPLFPCAMSAVIATSGHQLSDFNPVGNPAGYYYFNDPWDYFGFVIANSHPHTNSDGYGVVAYPSLSDRLQDNNMWHKRVLEADDFGGVYYTGNYMYGPLAGAIGRYDVMDRALQCIRDPSLGADISLVHARNASGLTYGNHPFWFHHGRRTYSFMHNGNSSPARSFMIAEINRMSSADGWFNVHPSNYFADTDPYHWVDSEVMFHYIISHILACGDDVTWGIINAMRGIRNYLGPGGAGIYNFIMSDGEKLYAFRSTSSFSYQLSYKIGPGWIGIRTQNPYSQETRLRPMELVVLSQDSQPQHIMVNEYYNIVDMQHSDPLSIGISPNPAGSDGVITLTPKYPLGTGKDPAKIEIFNSKGQLVISKDIPDISSGAPINLKLNSMTSGVYFCRIRSGGYATTTRFSIVK